MYKKKKIHKLQNIDVYIKFGYRLHYVSKNILNIGSNGI